MQSFVRMTKLSNISGRAGYITNSEVQEEIVIVSEAVDWQPYVQYERANQKTSVKNNEGRELIIALPNEWEQLRPEDLKVLVQHIAETAVGKSTDMQWAVHWNKDRTNLHVHIIFSERTKETEIKRWDRDIYLTEDGKIARNKVQRARDADGSILPPVHRKGDIQGGFTAKDTQYKRKGWLQDKKQQLIELYEKLGVTIDKQGVLHQYHEGKGTDSAKIREKNEAVKYNNKLFEAYLKQYNLAPEPLKKQMQEASQQAKVMNVYRENGQLKARFEPVAEVKRQLRAAQQKEQPKPAPTRAEQLRTACTSFIELQQRLNSLSRRKETLKKPAFWQKEQLTAYNSVLSEINENYAKISAERDKCNDIMKSLGIDISEQLPKSFEELQNWAERRCIELDREDNPPPKPKTDYELRLEKAQSMQQTRAEIADLRRERSLERTVPQQQKKKEKDISD